jgi:hypothetical protein
MWKKIFSILILTIFITTSLLATGSENYTSEQPSNNMSPVDFDNNSIFRNVLARVDTTEGNVQLPRGIELVGGMPGEWLDIILPNIRLSELSDAGIEYSVLISDVDAYSQSFAGQYHTLAQIEQILEDIADDYPDITSLYSIGTTYEGRDIWCLEISDNPGVDEGEPGVFYMGLHHAREWPTVEICLYIADQLTSLYGSDPDITNVVNNRRLWLVTCINPDGYYYCYDQGHDWRKNRNYFPEFGTYGVDLNRNYAGSSNGDPWGAWGSLGSASVTHKPGDSLYCGPGPISELETQAIKNMFIDNDISASITWHTHGELVLWPWSFSQDITAPDDSYMSQVGVDIASRISNQQGGGTYTPKQGSFLYPTTGDLTDWAYGYCHYVLGKPVFVYTIEACNTFHPLQIYLDQIVEENFDGALYLLQEAENIKNTVEPRVIAPVIDDMTTDPDGNYIVSWQEQNPDADPDVYQLDELSDLTLLIDDAEDELGLWDIEGFTVSTLRCHSESHSYKSSHSNEIVDSMTSIYPLPVTEDTELGFWCWYNIEDDWDYAIVEISSDGRLYDVLDTFTGSSSGWVNKEYDLSEYEDESVFIRFRYTTDSNTLGEGFYVDDISPVPEFTNIETISDTIIETSYEITGNVEGTYYYRVRGHNDAYEWGDFSTIEKIVVGGGSDTEPPELEIISPSQNYLYLMNRRIIPFFTTVIIGDIDIIAEAIDPSGINRVEFYIDGQLMETISDASFQWKWTENAFLKHNIKVIAVDNYENVAEEEITVSKFF